MAWPNNRETFPELEKVQDIFSRIIYEIKKGEIVELLCTSAKEKENAQTFLSRTIGSLESVQFRLLPYVDVWLRDTAPIFLLKPGYLRPVPLNLGFNAWGEKYDDLLKDKDLGPKISAIIDSPLILEDPFILEGGSIDTNGKGILLTSESCLLNPNRNPTMNKTEIEEKLKNLLSVDNILWFESGIEGDDTDGHVDDFARFTSENTILLMTAENKTDPNYCGLKQNQELLERFLKNHPDWSFDSLPSPVMKSEDGRMLPASYANFYIANSSVLVPVFDLPQDEAALEIIASHFPGKPIAAVPVKELLGGFGGIHCVTQQEPRPIPI